MKGAEMFVVSLRCVNFRFWSKKKKNGKTSLCLAVKVSFKVALKEILKNIYIFSIRFVYSIHVIKVYNDRF